LWQMLILLIELLIVILFLYLGISSYFYD